MAHKNIFLPCNPEERGENIILSEKGKYWCISVSNQIYFCKIDKKYGKNRKNIENKMQKKYQKYLIDSNYKWMPRKVKKVLLFPGMIFCRIKMKLSHNNTPFEDEKKLEIILQDNVQ